MRGNVYSGNEGPGRKDVLETKAEEDLTSLGEQEREMESENETAELDTVNRPVKKRPVDPRYKHEAPPMSHSGGGID